MGSQGELFEPLPQVYVVQISNRAGLKLFVRLLVSMQPFHLAKHYCATKLCSGKEVKSPYSLSLLLRVLFLVLCSRRYCTQRFPNLKTLFLSYTLSGIAQININGLTSLKRVTWWRSYLLLAANWTRFAKLLFEINGPIDILLGCSPCSCTSPTKPRTGLHRSWC